MIYPRRILALLCLTLGACGPAPGAITITAPASPAVCAQREGLPALSVDAQLAATGEQPNVMVRERGSLWILESGNNTLSRYLIDEERFDEGFVDLGNDRGPYDVHIDGERGFVTNLLANTVSVVDLQSGEVIKEISDPRLKQPSGVTTTREHLYVSSVNFTNGVWKQGSVAVIERATYEVLGTIAVSAPNPQYLTALAASEAGEAERLAVVSTGTLARVDGRYVQESVAGLEIWTVGEDALAPTREVFELPAPTRGSRVGAPGRALQTPDGSRLYMTSATAPVAFVFDLSARAFTRGHTNPIPLYEADSDTLHASAMDAQGLLWVVSFNQDAAYVLDTACDEVLAGPISVGVVDDELEGPIAIAPPEKGEGAADIYVVNSLSKRLGRITLTR